MRAIDTNQRLGLALSGGGFRASFYHIGVLARMAELGMLKHVESISTVSGGSIVGAAYYLLLKGLLEGKADQDIVDGDYVKLVERLETHFLSAVQRNLRMRTFANPLKNMRMALPNYSRSDTIGEIYEKYIYKSLLDIRDRRIRMSDLLITPRGIHGQFHPWNETTGNPVRKNKVPVLILNATSLNSGHNWIFTATSMGEVPPRNLNFRDIDKKDRYRRVRYDEIKTRKPYFLLGNAVAASAGVPGLFPPMAVSNLYKDRRVQLVDGGVYDNQGIAGLLDPDCLCTDFIVSDASGQSDATDNPPPDTLSVVLKSSSILADRVREEMVNNLEETRDRHVAYFHLTRGLFAKDIEFNEGGVSDVPGVKMSSGIAASEKEFDVSQEAQRALAHIRTDLDSFTDVEAGCLQADGYQMSEPRLVKLSEFLATGRVSGQWRFDRYRSVLRTGDKRAVTQLDIGSQRFFKPLLYVVRGATTLWKSLGLILVSVPLVASLVVIFAIIDWLLKTNLAIDVWKIITDKGTFQAFLSHAAPSIYVFLIALVLSSIAEHLIRGSGRLASLIQKILKGPMSLIIGLVVRIVLPAIFAVPILIYVYTVDRYFIKVMGKLEK